MRAIHSTCPIVRKEALTLYQQVEVGGCRKMVPFEQEILWLRESESRIVLRHRGAEVDGKVRLNDYYGYLTSVEEAIRDAWAFARQFHITIQTLLCVDIDVQISETPVMADNSRDALDWNKKPTRRRQYLSLPDVSWFTSDQQVQREGYKCYPCLERRVIEKTEPLWSTRTQPDLSAWLKQRRDDAAASAISTEVQ